MRRPLATSKSTDRERRAGVVDPRQLGERRLPSGDAAIAGYLSTRVAGKRPTGRRARRCRGRRGGGDRRRARRTPSSPSGSTMPAAPYGLSMTWLSSRRGPSVVKLPNRAERVRPCRPTGRPRRPAARRRRAGWPRSDSARPTSASICAARADARALARALAERPASPPTSASDERHDGDADEEPAQPPGGAPRGDHVGVACRPAGVDVLTLDVGHGAAVHRRPPRSPPPGATPRYSSPGGRPPSSHARAAVAKVLQLRQPPAVVVDPAGEAVPAREQRLVGDLDRRLPRRLVTVGDEQAGVDELRDSRLGEPGESSLNRARRRVSGRAGRRARRGGRTAPERPPRASGVERLVELLGPPADRAAPPPTRVERLGDRCARRRAGRTARRARTAAAAARRAAPRHRRRAGRRRPRRSATPAVAAGSTMASSSSGGDIGGQHERAGADVLADAVRPAAAGRAGRRGSWPRTARRASSSSTTSATASRNSIARLGRRRGSSTPRTGRSRRSQRPVLAGDGRGGTSPASSAPTSAVATSVSAARSAGDGVVAGHHHDDRAAVGAQPRHESGAHDRALARAAGADDGDHAARHRRARASSSTTPARPKNAAASASSNGRRPLYGLMPAAVDRASRTAAWRRAESTAAGRRTRRASSDAFAADHRDPPRQTPPRRSRRSRRPTVAWRAPRRVLARSAARRPSGSARLVRHRWRGTGGRGRPVSSSHSSQPKLAARRRPTSPAPRSTRRRCRSR